MEARYRRHFVIDRYRAVGYTLHMIETKTRECPMCGKPVERKPGAGRPPIYCSDTCRYRAHHKRIAGGK